MAKLNEEGLYTEGPDKKDKDKKLPDTGKKGKNKKREDEDEDQDDDDLDEREKQYSHPEDDPQEDGSAGLGGSSAI